MYSTKTKMTMFTIVMYGVLLVGALLLIVAITGCNRGSVKISPVVEGQAAPHAGYNFGPDSYVEPGDEVKVSGFVLWLEGTEPNDILGN